MSRIVKEPEVRRKEIIEVSKMLFETKGYDNTSVENIISEANIAKGTFYYYFKTKKDVLDEVVNEISEEIFDLVNSIAESKTISVLEKLRLIFTGTEKQSVVNSKVMDSIHKVENRELQEKMNIYYIEKIIPIITDVFNKGYVAGLWRNEISVHNMKVIFGGAQFILDSGLFLLDKNERKAFLVELEKLLGFILGAEPRKFSIIFEQLI